LPNTIAILSVHALTTARPRDPNQLGKFIVDIATGEVEYRCPCQRNKAKTRPQWQWE
jgi:hypothetical protein